MSKNKKPPPAPNNLREVNRTASAADPRVDPTHPTATVPPVSGPMPLGRLPVTQSGQRRGSNVIDAHSPVDATRSTPEEAIRHLQAELRGVAAIEQELRERTIDQGMRITELEEALKKQERQNAELRRQVAETNALRDSVEKATFEIAQLLGTLHRERAEKAVLAEKLEHLQRRPGSKSTPEF
jgi:hypothetical protein